MAKKQPKYAVLDYWKDSVYNAYGFYPQMNRNTEQWAARDLIDSYGMSTVLELIDYYISISTTCLLYTSPSPRDLSTSRMPSSA